MLRAHSIRGVRTHVSDPKRNTACMSILNKYPKNFGYAPFLIKILIIRTQMFLDFRRVPVTSGQFVYPAIITLPRYLNDVMVSNGSPYSRKHLSKLSCRSSSTRRLRFLSAPLAHWEVARCLLFRENQGIRMFQWGHRGWGMLPSSKLTTVSRTCWWKKCTCIAVFVDARPGHPSTGQLRGPQAVGNSIL